MRAATAGWPPLPKPRDPNGSGAAAFLVRVTTPSGGAMLSRTAIRPYFSLIGSTSARLPL